MIFGITTSQQELVKKAIKRQQQIERELNFSQSSLDISLKKDISYNQPNIPRTSFSSFKSEKNDDKQSLRKFKTMGSIAELDKFENKLIQKDKKQNLLNC